MRKTKGFITCLLFVSIYLIDTPFVKAQRNSRRQTKTTTASNYASSSGLRTNTTLRCDKPGDPGCIGSQGSAFLSCGKNAQKNSSQTACECIDPLNYVINPANPNECIAKTDSFAIAGKKACGNALINAIEIECENSFYNNGMNEDNTIKCYDANDLFLKFDTSSIVVFIEGIQYKYDDACIAYTEELTKSIAEDYNLTGANSPNCKLKRTVAEASNECFQAVLSTGKAYDAVDSIENKLENLCGIQGLRAKWTKLFGEEELKGIIFPTNIPQLYINAGKLSPADGLELVGNVLDGKFTDKSNTWERDITMILNSHLNEVASACGQEYATQMHDTNIQISDEKSSLQRAIDEQGSIKGAQTWIMQQASTIIGENKANKLVREGTIGGIKDEDIGNNSSTTILELSQITEEELAQQNNLTSGIYLLTSGNKYRIVEIRKTGTGTTATIEYKTIPYSNDLQLSTDALKAIIGKEEDTTLNQNDYISLDN